MTTGATTRLLIQLWVVSLQRCEMHEIQKCYRYLRKPVTALQPTKQAHIGVKVAVVESVSARSSFSFNFAVNIGDYGSAAVR